MSLVSEYGLTDVIFEHKLSGTLVTQYSQFYLILESPFVESDSVATEPGRAENSAKKKRKRSEADTPPSDIKSSLRMTPCRRAALSRYSIANTFQFRKTFILN